MIEAFINAMDKALDALNRYQGKTVRLFHHNDADGLTSAAILTRAFERKGRPIRRSALEKPYPAVLERIFDGEGDIIVFADFAGRIAPLISGLNRGRNLVLILDHHAASPATDPQVHNLDPELYGLKGDLDISASVTCYLFAKRMDEGNADLSALAALGAVGDEFFLEGKLAGENRRAVLEAAARGAARIEEGQTGETYHFLTPRGESEGSSLAEYIATLGAVGYYREGPEAGVAVCLQGPTAASDRMYGELKTMKEERFRREIGRLQAGDLHRTEHIQWFHVEDRFAPMGVKMVGAFCDVIRKMDFVDPGRYLAGFQRLSDFIPGFGPVGMADVKVSMRVSGWMEWQIRGKTAMGLNRLLPEATAAVGGFSDACHSLAAATTVGRGKEEQLIAEMEKILKRGDSSLFHFHGK
ncbi:MAG: DHH family phosphoesterase [Deltaproteobacteria bacterium]|nr:DHH family phosphoesterase [Deltaproteobacteria bacterium]